MYFTNLATLHRVLGRHRRAITSIPTQSLSNCYAEGCVKRWLTTSAEWTVSPEYAGLNAYDILGVSNTSSFAEIKASFRKLAKETHPDLAHSQNRSPDASKKFIQILAAYEILSDSTRRAHYDRHILFKETPTKRHGKRDPIIFSYSSFGHPSEEMEVVEWLKWYRYTINDILAERRVGSVSGYFDELETDLYSAIRAAYYGPKIDSMDLLPSCFEAEERSIHTTSEVLHLVFGRELFGMVYLANKLCELSHACPENDQQISSGLESHQLPNNIREPLQSDADEHNHSLNADYQSSDTYRDLVLHLCGRTVAVATRVPPESLNSTAYGDFEDKIYVYLTSSEDSLHTNSINSGDTSTDSSAGSRILLGVIEGLGSTSEEGTCYVYDSAGIKTHMIMKHRTLLVKHLHWFRIAEKFSVCECRCTRARLPPSKYWLFEPRCAMHDIGGWYIETFGRDGKGKTIPAKRYWDGLDTDEHFEERLHPAMYLIAAAYTTLDVEELRRRKTTIRERVGNVFSWCKKRD